MVTLLNDLGNRYRSTKEFCSREITGKLSQDDKNRILSVTRTIVDISIITFQPYFTIPGVMFSVLYPEPSRQLCGIANGALASVYEDSTFEAKIVVAIVITSAAYFWLPFVSAIASIYAVKVGAELSNRNLPR